LEQTMRKILMTISTAAIAAAVAATPTKAEAGCWGCGGWGFYGGNGSYGYEPLYTDYGAPPVFTTGYSYGYAPGTYGYVPAYSGYYAARRIIGYGGYVGYGRYHYVGGGYASVYGPRRAHVGRIYARRYR
jgi:hypothetical protein